MTPEEIQKAIEGMLAIQRELQNTQLRMSQEISDLKQSVSELNDIGRRHERRLEQLVGYSITSESDRLDVLERIISVEQRVSKLENE